MCALVRHGSDRHPPPQDWLHGSKQSRNLEILTGNLPVRQHLIPHCPPLILVGPYITNPTPSYLLYATRLSISALPEPVVLFFKNSFRFRLILHTDAIWRACRIILDVRLHRGEIGVDEAVDFMIDQTRFERDNARSEVEWYTYRPTYPMSYLLGRTLLLELRADEQRRLGEAFSLRDFHDGLLRNGSLPISFHRRLLAGEGA